jgi:hypothetical protein
MGCNLRAVSVRLRVIALYNKVADSGDVVIQEQGFPIVGTHEPGFSMPLALVFVHTMARYPHKKSNIPSRTSSGSTSIRITWPTSHHVG